MPLYLKGNRILTQSEKDDEDLNDGCSGAVMILIGLLFILSPGILVTSILTLFIDFTTSQLWGSAIVASIVVLIALAVLLGGEGIIKNYLITALCCSLFMFVYYLFKPDNCYYNTIMRMLDSESSENKSPSNNSASDSVAYISVSNTSNNATAYYSQSNNETEEFDEADYEEEENEERWATDKSESSYSENDNVHEEIMPSFPGGQEALMKYLSDNVVVPTYAEENGIQGRVVVSYVIECDGSVTDVQVVQSVHPVLDDEAIRVVKNMPKWIPGKQDGKDVSVKFSIPITFRFQ